MRIFTGITLLLALLGCSNGSNNNGGESEPETTSTLKPVTITATGSTISIDEKERYNLAILGQNNTITIAGDDDIEVLSVVGQNNMITLLPTTSIAIFVVTGSGNSIFVPVGSGILFVDSGLGNTLTEV